MNNIILLVFEGARTEVRVFNAIKKEFFANETNTVHVTYNTSIYQLWEQMNDDEDLDLLEILRERSKDNKLNLKGIERENISQIFLFFDYDGQETMAEDDKIQHMLAHFQEETDNGKLFISYPMVEALKDLNDTSNYEDNIVIANEDKGYKKVVGESSKYQDLRKLNADDWQYIIKENLCKGNLIVNDEYIMPNARLFQDVIFDNQLSKFIIPDTKVAVLSAFPFFIPFFWRKDNSI